MTVDLLPSPQATRPARRTVATEGDLLPCVHGGPQDGGARFERNCPYCCGPETD